MSSRVMRDGAGEDGVERGRSEEEPSRVRGPAGGGAVIGIDASRAFAASPTGTETYAHEVVRSLVELGGHEYRLYLRGRPAIEPPPGIRPVVLGAARLWTHVGLAWEVARRPPDVLFIPSHVMPVFTRPPAVVTVHDLGYLAFPETHPWSQRAYLHATTRHHAHAAAALIADSESTKRDLATRYGASPDRITVVHLGVDPSMRPVPERPVRDAMTSLGLPHGSRYVLHVGTLQPRKNLGRLVQAFAGVLETVPDVHLVLVGKRGWGDEDLGRLARTLGVAERVLTPGYLPREMLPAVYSGAAAVLIPSLYEGFGLPALEAMACGTPVACSSTSSLPEVVGDAGLLFDPLDTDAIGRAMLRLLEDDSLRARMSHEGRARAALFTWERCARSTLAVIDGVLAGKDLRQT